MGAILDSSCMDPLHLINKTLTIPSTLPCLLVLTQNMAISSFHGQMIHTSIYAIFLFKILQWLTTVLRVKSKLLGMEYMPHGDLS